MGAALVDLRRVGDIAAPHLDVADQTVREEHAARHHLLDSAALELVANATASPIFRLIEDARPAVPTFLFDEADSYFKSDKEDLRGIINSGWMKISARVIRTDGDGNQRRARYFSTWAPKAIGTIKAVADTLMDRGIIIKMRRATKAEKKTVQRFLMRDTPQFEELRRKCLRWASEEIAHLTKADPSLPESLANRPADNWRPFIAMADAAGGEWPKRAREAALELSGLAAKRIGHRPFGRYPLHFRGGPGGLARGGGSCGPAHQARKFRGASGALAISQSPRVASPECSASSGLSPMISTAPAVTGGAISRKCGPRTSNSSGRSGYQYEIVYVSWSSSGQVN